MIALSKAGAVHQAPRLSYHALSCRALVLFQAGAVHQAAVHDALVLFQAGSVHQAAVHDARRGGRRIQHSMAPLGRALPAHSQHALSYLALGRCAVLCLEPCTTH